VCVCVYVEAELTMKFVRLRPINKQMDDLYVTCTYCVIEFVTSNSGKTL